MSMIELQWNPDRRQMQYFGLMSVAVFGGLGLAMYLGTPVFGLEMASSRARAVAGALSVIAMVSAVLTVLAPLALRPLYWLLTVISFPIGFVVSHVVVAVLFFAMLTPIAIVFRLRGRDALARRFDRRAASYWVKRAPARQDRYFRQF